MLGVALRNGLDWHMSARAPSMTDKWATYIEELDVVEDVVVESKVVAGNAVDASILLDLPVGKAKTLALSQKILLGELAAPVGLVSLLEVTQLTHAGETQDC